MKGLRIRSQYKTDFKNLIKINYKLIESTQGCRSQGYFWVLEGGKKILGGQKNFQGQKNGG